jgi:galactokinase
MALGQSHLPSLLFRRFRHVVTEAARVYAAETAMSTRDLRTFAALMNASHDSLRDDYEVSSPELDEMVGLAREGGAAGARLTGAGFGGCMVALTHAPRVGSVLTALEDRYYRPRGVPGSLDSVLFAADPWEGATVREL